MDRPIYLDYNATTPLAPEVIEEMIPFMKEHFGNPSSSHYYGREPKKAIEVARERVAKLLNCSPEEIIFTSGGTESNNHALRGIAESYREKGNHIITTAIEHHAIIEPCLYLMKQGFEISFLKVDRYGVVDLDQLAREIRPETILISVMHANNEVGTVQPLSDIKEIIGDRDIILHTDAAQSVGKIPTDVEKLRVDLLSVAGHKLYAPKGIGALYVRKGVKLPKFIHGAGQERGLRAGTENVIEIVGLGKACELAADNLEDNSNNMKKTRDLLAEKLLESLPQIKINGHPSQRLPNTLSISFPGLEANRILDRLTSVAASAGAACHSNEIKISHVLDAMGIPIEYAKGTLRFSTGIFTTTEQVLQASEDIIRAVKTIAND
ncbi:MAG: cysteine desulfurase NifS [Deltaproteobacteria bacterium]|nr:MAG: cysteine desulfurase NifS [Deltaproteobacteria bacterium]